MASFFADGSAQRVLARLDRSTAQVFEACLLDSSAIAADPVAAVTAHQARLQTASQHNEFLDLTLAQGLTRRSLALLDRIGPGTLDAHRKLILAAVYYFILDEDAESDTGSILGLEDDEQVIQAVENELDSQS